MSNNGKVQTERWKYYQGVSHRVNPRKEYFKNFHYGLHLNILHSFKEDRS